MSLVCFCHSDDSIVTAIDITSNGKLVLTGSSSGTLSLVSLEDYQAVETFATTEAGVGVRLVCILSDEARFVFIDQTNRVELRDFYNKEVELLLDQPAVKVTCITALGVDYVLLGCENGELSLFNLYVKQKNYKHQAHSKAVSQVKSVPVSLLHFVSGSASGCVKLWYVTETVPPLWSQIWSHDNVYPHPITALTFVPDSGDIVIGSFYGNKVYRINAAGIVSTYEFDGHRVATLRVVEDSLIAAGLLRDAFKVIKWSLNEGLVINEIDWYWGKQHYDILRVNNASNHVASIDCNSLLIWNLKCGTMLHRVDITHDIRALAVVPGSEFLLSGSLRHKTLKLWNLRNGRFVEEFQFDHGVETIACSSNGMVCVGLRGGWVCFLRFNNLSYHSGQLKQQGSRGSKQIQGV
ncbi:WD40 repeat domain-containing [Paramuricea clavata]|uniref:WD40 repeat domain-containing n=1 Tax=Paramuricea clavata TaxID=317549 RepID=A0A6S7FJC9_PARCT|nr:WD40 repeat domain-containing [Paramuricea clavata]